MQYDNISHATNLPMHYMAIVRLLEYTLQYIKK